MKTSTLAFIREGSRGVENLAVVKVTHKPTIRGRERILAAIERGLNKWIGTTPEGADAWEYSSADFNIGDLLNCDESFVPFLASEGIEKLEVLYELADPDIVAYDTVLACPE